MNTTFAALLEIAYSYGGGLLKFGGDALLLLYAGDDHAARRARAAFEMRRPLQRSDAPDFGRRVSSHARRPPQRALPLLPRRESHRELLVTGPAATRTVEMEASSEAGEILLSPEAARHSAPVLVAKRDGDFSGSGPDR